MEFMHTILSNENRSSRKTVWFWETNKKEGTNQGGHVERVFHLGAQALIRVHHYIALVEAKCVYKACSTLRVV